MSLMIKMWSLNFKDMKTKKNGFIMPILAFMIAIAAAFATEKNSMESTLSDQAYLNTPVPCTLAGFCDNTGIDVCTSGGIQVYGKSSATQCTRKLFMPWHN